MNEEADLAEQLRALKEEIERQERERLECEDMHRERLHELRSEANKIALRLQFIRMRNELS